MPSLTEGFHAQGLMPLCASRRFSLQSVQSRIPFALQPNGSLHMRRLRCASSCPRSTCRRLTQYPIKSTASAFRFQLPSLTALGPESKRKGSTNADRGSIFRTLICNPPRTPNQGAPHSSVPAVPRLHATPVPKHTLQHFRPSCIAFAPFQNHLSMPFPDRSHS